MKLRSKILIYTLPLILLPLIALAIANYYFVIRANQIEKDELKARSLNEVTAGIRKEIELAAKDAKLLASVPAVSKYLLAQNKKSGEAAELKGSAQEALKIFFEQNPFYLKLALTDKHGTEHVKFNRLEGDSDTHSLTGEEFFRRGLSVYRVGYYQTPISKVNDGEYVSIFVAPVLSGEFQGMVVLTLDAAVFESRLNTPANRNLTTLLFDDRGTLFCGFSNRLKVPGLTEDRLEEIAADMLKQDTITSEEKPFLIDNKKVRFSVQPAYFLPTQAMFQAQEGSKWFLAILEPKPSGWNSNAFLFLFVSSLALAVGVMYLAANAFAKRITNPIERVSLATANIARGEVTPDLEINSGDEIEDLANAVKSMSSDLKKYQDELVRSAKLATMGEMTARISHEIQNRLSGMSLWVQYLDSELKEDDPMRGYLNEMKQGLEGFTDLLANLKSYYRTPKLDLGEVNVNSLVENSIPFVREKIDAKEAEISLNLVSLPIIKADYEKLRSVIINLLLNAVEAIDNGGRIGVTTKIRVTKGIPRIKLLVSDNGAGIGDADLSQIFFPFYSTKSSGSGLGLAISSNIISAHKGKIDVESELGKGTTFSVELSVGEAEVETRP